VLSVIELSDTGDGRGRSFGPPPELFAQRFPLGDLHLSTIVPGAVRGNHYHLQRRELLAIMATEPWSLHWDSGEGTPVQSRTFDGRRAVLVTIPIGSSHAVRNDGTATLHLFGLTDGPYEADRPDAYRRVVVS
jgi:oxalate decarboxylase/phosphoglucose isomerase-like protein (cupin superfamily)